MANPYPGYGIVIPFPRQPSVPTRGSAIWLARPQVAGHRRFFFQSAAERDYFFFRAALLVHVVCVFFFPSAASLELVVPLGSTIHINLRLATKQKAPVKERIK